MSRLELHPKHLPPGSRRAGFLRRETSEGWRLSNIDLARARLILDLHGPMGVNDEGIAVVLHLLDQVHGLRRALRGANAIYRQVTITTTTGPGQRRSGRSSKDEDVWEE